MTKKIPSAIVIALLSAFLSGHAVAVTEQEAHAQLDRIPAQAVDAKQTAQSVLSELVKAGVPVDQAYEVVRSCVEHNYSASDLHQIGNEIRGQVGKGIPAKYVAKAAGLAIGAGYSASATQKVLDNFQSRVEKGMPADQAYASSTHEIKIGARDGGAPAGMTGGAPAGMTGGAPAGMTGGAPAGMTGGAGAAMGGMKGAR